MQGSLEALTESLQKLERDEVKLGFVHRGVGGITENDVQLAAASNATIIGFNVRPDRKARELAEHRRTSRSAPTRSSTRSSRTSRAAMVGMLKPEFEEVVTGEAEVREVFRVPRVGAVAGCYVRNGVITRGSKVRFLREGVIIWKGTHHVAAALQGRRPRGAEPASSAASASPTSRTSRAATSSRPTRSGRSPARSVHVRAVELHLPTCHSLKEKRAVIKPILEGCRRRFQVAVAEVGYQDKWQRAALGVAVVSGLGRPRRRGARRGRALRVVVPRGRGRRRDRRGRGADA